MIRVTEKLKLDSFANETNQTITVPLFYPPRRGRLMVSLPLLRTVRTMTEDDLATTRPASEPGSSPAAEYYNCKMDYIDTSLMTGVHIT
jgi:hypothetical protein